MSARSSITNRTTRELVPDLHRGNRMHFANGIWKYARDGVEVSQEPSRACGHCGRENDEAGHDGCIGFVPGVVSACCGHGASTRDTATESKAWVILESGVRLSGAAALRFMRRIPR